jgi:hypothetical protein
MHNKTLIILILVFTTFSLNSCKCHKNASQTVTENNNSTPVTVNAIAPVIIYKTTSDFYNNVPVILSDDKTDIVSFPDRSDVYFNGKLAYPTRLDNGYLLDNRGIGKNVAFLNITYEQYSKLSATPTKTELLKMILDKNPLTELYNCNQLPSNNIQMLNEAIKNGIPTICENLIK